MLPPDLDSYPKHQLTDEYYRVIRTGVAEQPAVARPATALLWGSGALASFIKQ